MPHIAQYRPFSLYSSIYHYIYNIVKCTVRALTARQLQSAREFPHQRNRVRSLAYALGQLSYTNFLPLMTSKVTPEVTEVGPKIRLKMPLFPLSGAAPKI